jgi:hypothetical protein
MKFMADKNLVARCGLYCGSCSRYIKKKCSGCKENAKLTWCKIRKCCTEKEISTCAHCDEHQEVNNCGKFNNFISKIISFIFRTDRSSSLKKIKEEGREKYANEMEESKKMALKK